MYNNSLARQFAVVVATLSLLLAGLLVSPAAGAEHRLSAAAPTSDVAAGQNQAYARREDPWVRRLHATANNERVDLRESRIDKVWNQHKVNFTALVRVVERARSPRKSTSPKGIDRGVYQYRIYEYVYENGDLKKTGRWVVVQAIIEWGDGVADRGWLVTAYPVSTSSGTPPKDSSGNTYCPSWLASAAVMGPVNNDILY